MCLAPPARVWSGRSSKCYATENLGATGEVQPLHHDGLTQNFPTFPIRWAKPTLVINENAFVD